jgi:ketosteroid isomerase-like protein
MKKLISVALLAGVLAGNTMAQTMEMNKKTAREAYEALIKYDSDKFLSYLADDAIDYAQGPKPVQGKAAIAANLNDFFRAFPGYTLTVEGIAADGNKVYVQNTFKGMQKAMLAGMIPATGKTVIWSDVDILEFDQNGKLRAHWANNSNAVLDQIGYHAFTNPNTQIILAAYDQFGKGNVAGILAQCTPDVVFDVTDRVFLPNGMVYKGATEVPNFFRTLAEKVTFTKFDPYRFLADGDDVAVYINGEYKDNKTGKLLKANIVHQFKVINGKITWFKGNTDVPKEITMATK